MNFRKFTTNVKDDETMDWIQECDANIKLKAAVAR